MRTKAILLTCLMLLSSCADIASMSCADVADRAVDISNDALVKIRNRKLISHSPTEIDCEGTGVFRSGSEFPTTFRAYRHSDGDVMVTYNATDPELAAIKEQADKGVRELEKGAQEMRQALRENGFDPDN